MLFYKISLAKTPNILFAHGYQSDNYNIVFRLIPKLVEITYVEKGDIISSDAGGVQEIFPESSVITMPHDHPFSLTCNGASQTHFTVGFFIENKIETLNSEQLISLGRANSFDAVLPRTIPPYRDTSRFQKLIKKIIYENSIIGSGAQLKCVGCLFELISELTRYSFELAAEERDETLYLDNVYCRRALVYIAEHVGKKIYVSQVAAAAGISYGYLNSLFRKTMGMTLVDYINHIKLQRVKELLTTKSMSLEEAGRSAGINDVKYLSRLFKKYNGITAINYKLLHNNAFSPVVEKVVIKK